MDFASCFDKPSVDEFEEIRAVASASPKRTMLSSPRKSGELLAEIRSLTRGESVIVASSDPLADTGDVTDPTEYVARKLAGQIDFIMSLSIPISYVIIVCIVLRPFDEDEGVFQEDFKCTTLSHIHDGVRAWTDRC